MMDQLSNVYYLVELIVRQMFVYLRDLILYKFFWLSTVDEDFHVADSKLHGLSFRTFTADLIAFSTICVVLFVIVTLTSKCEKDEGRNPYATAGIEEVPVDFQESLCRVSNASSSTIRFEACGDSIYPRGRIPERNFSHESFSRVRSGNGRRFRCILKKSIFGLTGTQLHNSQSTQTQKLVPKMSHKWMVRRTRSGVVYGKYPL